MSDRLYERRAPGIGLSKYHEDGGLVWLKKLEKLENFQLTAILKSILYPHFVVMKDFTFSRSQFQFQVKNGMD